MINYDLSRIKAVVFDVDGVLSANQVPLGEDGFPVRTVFIKDGYALHLALKLGLDIAIMTGGDTAPVRRRFEFMQVKHIYMGSHRKTEQMADFLKTTGYAPVEVAYMGDDLPDFEVMQMVGLPCCPADASPEIKAISKYVSPFKGGGGCCRDLLEQILKVKGLWQSGPEAYIW